MNVWFTVDQSIHEPTGYSSRVRFELEFVRNHLNIQPMLLYQTGYDPLSEISALAASYPIPITKPRIIGPSLTARHAGLLAKIIGPPHVLYAENLTAAFLFKRFTRGNNIPLVCDYHGVVPEEMRMTYPGVQGIVRYLVFKTIERLVMQSVQAIVVVSDKLKRHLLSAYPFLSNRIIVELPMIPADIHLTTEKEQSSEVFSVVPRLKNAIDNNHTIFCYLGQAQSWQCVQETIAVYSRIERERKDTFFLVLTRDTEEFRKLSQAKGIKNIEIRSVPHAMVPCFLKWCDYGFVIRKPHLVNFVASPTKVLEYLSAGVRPILTEAVGDFSDFLTQEQLGVVVPYRSLKNIDTGWILSLQRIALTVKTATVLAAKNYIYLKSKNYESLWKDGFRNLP